MFWKKRLKQLERLHFVCFTCKAYWQSWQLPTLSLSAETSNIYNSRLFQRTTPYFRISEISLFPNLSWSIRLDWALEPVLDENGGWRLQNSRKLTRTQLFCSSYQPFFCMNSTLLNVTLRPISTLDLGVGGLKGKFKTKSKCMFVILSARFTYYWLYTGKLSCYKKLSF